MGAEASVCIKHSQSPLSTTYAPAALLPAGKTLMKHSNASKIILLLTLLTITTPVFAQGKMNAGAGARRESKVDALTGSTLEIQMKSRARNLAAAVAEQAFNWDDKQAAVRVLAQAADLLWKDNPEQARAWLMRAWEMAQGLADEDADNTIRRFRSHSPQSQARAAILVVAQKYDRPLAERLLNELADQDKQ